MSPAATYGISPFLAGPNGDGTRRCGTDVDRERRRDEQREQREDRDLPQRQS